MTGKKEVKFSSKSEMGKYIINNRDILYLVVDWEHLRIVKAERNE